MVQRKALTVARSLWNDEFKAPTGWLDSFKKRQMIVWNGTYYNFESATAVLAVRNTQNKDMEDDEEEEVGE
jgi:hypothetical protein